MIGSKTVYGEGILAGEINQLGEYIVVTDEVPWQLYQDAFPRPPLRVLIPGTLDQAELDRLAPSVPKGARIVGLGGGAVIDAAKYFAYLRNETPILVPTITSSNAQFSDFISIRKGGGPFGFRKDGLPRRIIVDYALIHRADARLNRAGYADVLCLQTTLNDWRIAAASGKTRSVDPALEKAILEIICSAFSNARDIGLVNRRGSKVLMSLLEDSTKLIMANPSVPISAGSEHLFAWNLERVTGEHFIHGEAVAFGILICSYLQKRDYKELRAAIESAHVIYRPEEMGIEWDEVEKTLLTVNEYNRKVRKFYTVFDKVEWTPHLMKELRELIYAKKEKGA